MKKTSGIVLKVGSRASPLAIVQVQEVFSLLVKAGKRVKQQLITFVTKGDKDKTTSLLTNPSDDFFSDALDEALLAGQIDIAIHSAKDLPRELRAGLKIFALTKTLDDTDALVAEHSYLHLSAGSRVGTSSQLRKAQILAANPKVSIVDIRGTVQERLNLFDQGKIDALIIATCALKRLGLEKRIKEILPWEGMPLQGQLAVVGREHDQQIEKIFSKIDVRRRYGKVFLVGAGPGDPGFFTLKGVEILKKADTVFYDYLVDKALLDYAPFAERINVGKRKGDVTMSQKELSRLLRQKVCEGKMVVRLKGGDPLIFGRGFDELAYLRSFHIDVEVVPGVSSATGIASSLGIPLTARGISSSVAFLSGHSQDERAPIIIPSTETLVFLMGLTKLKEIVSSLHAQNWLPTTPVAVISKGTMLDEKVVVGELANIEAKVNAACLAQPALIIVGKAVSLYSCRLGRKDNILYCGTYPQKYKDLGRLIHFPMIHIKAAKIKNPRAFIADLKNADIILLTSRCGVKYFLDFLIVKKFSLASLRSKYFIVIGADTQQQLGFYGFSANLVSKDETSEGLFKAMKKELDLRGKKIIFPRSSLANPYLRQELAKAGARIKEVVVYENIKPPKRDLPVEKIDRVIFTSPSTVQNFLADYGLIPKDWAILAKGVRTQQVLCQEGYCSEVLVSR